jgi:hypothetical protein
MLLLGGERSLAGSALWYVIWFEIPVSRAGRSSTRGLIGKLPPGVLLAALGILAFHFSGQHSAA